MASEDQRPSDALWPVAAPIAMLAAGTKGLRGWALGSARVKSAPVAARDRAVHPGTDLLAPGGHAVLTDVRSRARPAQDTSSFLGIHRTEVRSGATRRADFTPRTLDKEPRLFFGGSPDGQTVAVVEHWNMATEPMPDTSHLSPSKAAEVRAEYGRYVGRLERRSITIASFDGRPEHEILTAAVPPKSEYGHTFALDTIKSLVQWSPNGSLLAVWMPIDLDGVDVVAVRVFSTSTWRQVAEFPRAFLAGTASWGPESDRLLLETFNTHTRVRSVWIQHLDGDHESVEAIPQPNRAGTSVVRPLGLADNRRLVTVRAARGKATLSLTDAATGEQAPVVAWPDDNETRPAVAQLPPESWGLPVADDV